MEFTNEAPGSDSLQSASHEAFGALGGCMLDGDREQSNRERRIRRWSLGISVALQTVLITVMVMAPLLAKTGTISYHVTPFPPYAGSPKSPRHPAPLHTSPPRPAAAISLFVGIRPTMPQNLRPDDNPPGDPVFGFNSPVRDGVIPIDALRLTPPPPERERNPVTRVRVGHIEPAKLTKRVEPVYPALAIQIHRAGRVELHAIISTDGTIQSLEAIEGDALFVRSALDAVGQWRYSPTMLNGEPVEVDTHITVIYSMPR
jgi:protein TonB